MPTIAWTGSSVVIAATNTQGNLDFWWQAAGTSPWNPEQVDPTGLGSQFGHPSMVATAGSVMITATDGSGNLDYLWQQYGTSGWGGQQVAAG